MSLPRARERPPFDTISRGRTVATIVAIVAIVAIVCDSRRNCNCAHKDGYASRFERMKKRRVIVIHRRDRPGNNEQSSFVSMNAASARYLAPSNLHFRSGTPRLIGATIIEIIILFPPYPRRSIFPRLSLAVALGRIFPAANSNPLANELFVDEYRRIIHYRCRSVLGSSFDSRIFAGIERIGVGEFGLIRTTCVADVTDLSPLAWVA